MATPPKLHDTHAERAVLSGMMHDPDETMAGLQRMKFTRDKLYHDTHQKLYDVVCFVFYSGDTSDMLPRVYDETRRRREKLWLDTFGQSREFTDFLVDVWEANWFTGIERWADMRYPDRGQYAFVALAAAASVIHLASRRAAHYAAAELLRDTLDPTGDADEIEGRTDKLEGM